MVNIWKIDKYLIKYRGVSIFDIYKGKEQYIVDASNITCTCKGWFYGQRRNKYIKLCKHIDMVFNLPKTEIIEEWQETQAKEVKRDIYGRSMECE